MAAMHVCTIIGLRTTAIRGNLNEPDEMGSHRGHRCFRDTEVRQPCPTARIEQDVARFQVAMDDSTLMRVFQGLCNFQEYRNDFEEAGTA